MSVTVLVLSIPGWSGHHGLTVMKGGKQVGPEEVMIITTPKVDQH